MPIRNALYTFSASNKLRAIKKEGDQKIKAHFVTTKLLTNNKIPKPILYREIYLF